jgi:hypothetical protein
LKRSQALSTVRTAPGPKLPPILRLGASKTKPKTRTPILTITDDGDIPPAIQPKKEKEN